MFRQILRTTVRAPILGRNVRSYSTRTVRASTSPYAIYTGIGISLFAVPFIYNGISNDEQVEKVKKVKKVKESKPKEVESEESTTEEITEIKTEDSEEKPEVEGTSDEDRELTSEDYEGAAYNPITGEINWDCPCLGGMADGPCGEEFKEAFACFVYSETEPKGIDCIKKFEVMRTCFRQYPEHYKEQLLDDEELEAANQEKIHDSVDQDTVEVPIDTETESKA